MAWLLALSAEIFGRRDQSAAEMMLPEPIGEHAAGQRIFGIDDPFGQIEPTRRITIERRQDAERSWLNGRAGPEKIAANEHMSRSVRAAGNRRRLAEPRRLGGMIRERLRVLFQLGILFREVIG